jgi:hypothetical protein
MLVARRWSGGVGFECVRPEAGFAAAIFHYRLYEADPQADRQLSTTSGPARESPAGQGLYDQMANRQAGSEKALADPPGSGRGGHAALGA